MRSGGETILPLDQGRLGNDGGFDSNVDMSPVTFKISFLNSQRISVYMQHPKNSLISDDVLVYVCVISYQINLIGQPS